MREDGLTVSFEFAAHTEQVTGRRLVLFVVMHAEVETSVEKRDDVASGSQSLSRREREIVEQVARGESGEEIAARLGLSPETVRTHVRNAKESSRPAIGPNSWPSRSPRASSTIAPMSRDTDRASQTRCAFQVTRPVVQVSMT